MRGRGDPDHRNEDPSRWEHRLPLVALAVVGLGIASYLALYQAGVVSPVWEPLFGDGSRTILHSSVADALPIPDAALGAAVYLGEIVTGLVGGRTRWRTVPWVVLLYGLFVAGLGVGSILLVIAQGAWFHAWCTLCLGSAAISIVILVPGLREPLVTLRWLRAETRGGHSTLRALLGEPEHVAPSP